jgi:hypothetical protein
MCTHYTIAVQLLFAPYGGIGAMRRKPHKMGLQYFWCESSMENQEKTGCKCLPNHARFCLPNLTDSRAVMLF